MKVKSSVKAGKITTNHKHAVKGLRVEAFVESGGVKLNHSRTVSR